MRQLYCFGIVLLLVLAFVRFRNPMPAFEIITVNNPGGQTLKYANTSGVKILESGGKKFKDLNRNGKLDPYEDWRLAPEVRAANLASQMTIEQIAGLMLYSRHQAIPGASQGFMAATYGGKKFSDGGISPGSLTDQQIEFLTKDNVRHILITSVVNAAVAAQWTNNAQALVEGIGLGIPANNSSDPRHGTIANAEYNAGAGGSISMWPGSLGMAATFDPELVRQFGQIAAQEYRALGITTALSPQIDLATEPRWMRFNGTFGEDVQLATDMARAYIDGFQTSTGLAEIRDGWGYHSVNAMVKHWPGGGSGEGGRDAHYGYGKYAVYPGNNFATHFLPFVNGAFKLKGPTRVASAVMPYYTISYNQDSKNKENVGNSYNKYIINDLLRTKYKYDGVVCTDWLVTGDETAVDVFLTGKSWGLEKKSVAERHYVALMAGVDQFGGNNDMKPVIEAFEIGKKEHGEAFMRQRFEKSAVRLLLNIFRTGLFENPYLDPKESSQTVGKPDFMKAGYEAQLRSIVMLKNNSNLLPVAPRKKVYIPKRFIPAGRNFLGMETPEKLEYPISIELVKKYYEVTEDPAEADFALVCIQSPQTPGGYNADDRKNGGNGYMPISLQYKKYTASAARETSIAGGDPLESFTNRSYKGKAIEAINHTDLDMVLETVDKMTGKPVIVSLLLNNPTVLAEFEPKVQGILVNFGVQDQALLDIISGKRKPSGKLPLQMPADMLTVEKQFEDV
ncbi:MAG TPA: glycoside hydrolase family 3 N-terminal domain-containing protein, partial [Flavitalea sp.]|nr:glycoside hydrolase family 3 N-terminal domain-containing protein [Flavitalea sp.]